MKTSQWRRAVENRCVFSAHLKALSATPDYGLGTVGKCLGPTTSKGPTKDGCKIC